MTENDQKMLKVMKETCGEVADYMTVLPEILSDYTNVMKSPAARLGIYLERNTIYGYIDKMYEFILLLNELRKYELEGGK